MTRSARKPDFRYFVPAGLLFLFGGVFLHGILNAHDLAVRFPLLARTVPAVMLDRMAYLQGVPAGVEFGIRALVLALASLLIEVGFVGWAPSSLRALFRLERRVTRDFIFTLLCALQAMPALSAVSSLGLTYVVARLCSYAGQVALLHLIPSVAAQFAVLVLARSFVIYWQHRLSHRVPFLWQFHKFHHSAREMTGLNDFRGTPMTIAMTGSFVLVASQLLGKIDGSSQGVATVVAAGLFMAYVQAVELNAHVLHSKADTTYGWLGRYVFPSPGYHRVHHSALPEHKDKNFSVDFVIWDWLFGTRVDPATVPDRANIPLGFDANRYDEASLVYDYYLRPAVDALATIFPGAGRYVAPQAVAPEPGPMPRRVRDDRFAG